MLQIILFLPKTCKIVFISEEKVCKNQQLAIHVFSYLINFLMSLNSFITNSGFRVGLIMVVGR